MTNRLNLPQDGALRFRWLTFAFIFGLYQLLIYCSPLQQVDYFMYAMQHYTAATWVLVLTWMITTAIVLIPSLRVRDLISLPEWEWMSFGHFMDQQANLKDARQIDYPQKNWSLGLAIMVMTYPFIYLMAWLLNCRLVTKPIAWLSQYCSPSISWFLLVIGGYFLLIELKILLERIFVAQYLASS